MVESLGAFVGKKGFAVADNHTNHTTSLIALQSKGGAAYLLYASQKGKPEARTAILKKVAEENKSAPRDPEAAHMMFRFGPNLNADSVVDIESARDDAFSTALVERKADAIYLFDTGVVVVFFSRKRRSQKAKTNSVSGTVPKLDTLVPRAESTKMNNLPFISLHFFIFIFPIKIIQLFVCLFVCFLFSAYAAKND